MLHDWPPCPDATELLDTRRGVDAHAHNHRPTTDRRRFVVGLDGKDASMRAPSAWD
jgi:hypothetical protein